MSQLRESTRSVLYALCFFGLWVPVVWLVGAVIVAVHLNPLPSSGYKRATHAFLALTCLMLLIFIIAMPVHAATVHSYWQAQIGFEAISATFLTLYALFGCLFIAFADMTFRLSHGPLTADLDTALYLRGVHLGMNIGALFLLCPPLSLVGIPLVLHKIKKHRANGTALYVSSLVFGILAFLSVLALCLLLVIAGPINIQTEHRYYGQPICKRSVLQTDSTATVNANATVTATASASETYVLESATTSWLWETTAWTGWETPGWTGWDETTYCYRNGGEYIEYSSYPSLFSPGGAIALIVLSVFYWIFNFVFIGVADALILKSLTPTSAAPAGGVVLVHPCPSCSSPLQFVRTGPTTQVQCYKCSAVCEFQTA